MKNILIFLIINLPTLDLWSQSNSPNYQQIYNFQVGDIFLYKNSFIDCGSGNGDCTTTINYTKYEILSKITKNDTIIYTRKINGQTTDTITYIDSTTNILNANNYAIVVVKINPIDTIFAKVRIIKNSVLKKDVGGPNSIYEYNNGHFDSTLTSFKSFGGLTFIQEYEQGLGLMNQIYGQFEGTNTTYLVGYRKGLDTVGNLSVGIQTAYSNDKLKAYPNPCFDNLIINIDGNQENNSVYLYTLQGVLVKSLNESDNPLEISTSDLKPGIYLLKIFNSEGTNFFKIIKQ